MYLYNVIDQDINDFLERKYDVAIFASGFEERCIALPQKFNKNNIDMPIVLGFKEDSLNEQRTSNDKYYYSNWTNDICITSSNDEQPIYNQLNSRVNLNKETVRILVDYSSMSRLWYAGILNWAKYIDGPKELLIDMLYTPGIYREKIAPLVINDILSIPGCEGSATSLFKSVAVLGLGFDSLATLCVLDRLEPDLYYAFLASPTISPEYPKIVYDKNKELVKGASKTIELPLYSVEQTFVNLAEIISLHRSEADIIFVPMGPKPHVLASILVTMKFGDVTCLRVSTLGGNQQNIISSGHAVATSIVFKADTDGSDFIDRK